MACDVFSNRVRGLVKQSITKFIAADVCRDERELTQFNFNLVTAPVVAERNQTIILIHTIKRDSFHGSTRFGLQNRDAIKGLSEAVLDRVRLPVGVKTRGNSQLVHFQMQSKQ